MYSNVTQEVKDKFKENGSIKRGYIKVLQTDTQEEIVYNESSLKDFTILDDIYTPATGLVGSVISKQIEINFFKEPTDDLVDKEVEAYIGVNMPTTPVYIPMGKFIVQKPEDNQTMNKTYLLGLDYMTKFNTPYKDMVTYPCTLKQLLQNICSQCGVTLATTTFANENFEVENNQFVGGESCRDVLRAISQVAGCYAKINRDGELELKFVDTSSSTQGLEIYTTNDYTKEMTLNLTTIPINRVVLSMSGIDGIESIYPPTVIPEDQVSQIVIADNPFLYTSEKRNQAIQNLYNAVKDFTYTDYEIKVLTPRPYQDSGDKIIVTSPDGTQHVTYLFTHEIKFNGGLKATLSASAETQTEKKYSYKSQVQKAQTRTEYIVDKANAEITQRIDSFSNFTNVKQTKDEETGTISSSLYLDNALNTNIIRLEIQAETIQGALYPSTTLYPSRTLYPRKAGNTYVIRLAQTPQSLSYQTFSFFLLTPLLSFGNVHDKLIIEFDEKSGNSVVYVERWLQKTGQSYEILEDPIEEILEENLPFILLDGSNYITLLVDGELKNWNMIATYLVKNELNKYYTTQIETSSIIKTTQDNILLQVSAELGDKADKRQLISQINLSPEDITIQSSKIALEGYTTINGGFSVDEKGNASIANGAVTIDDTGIQMADGTSILGGKGLLSNMEFVGQGNMNDALSGSYGQVGFRVNNLNSSNFRAKVTIDAYIPDNFTITKAVLVLNHFPLEVKYQSITRGTGYARNVKAYMEYSNYMYRIYNIDSMYFDIDSSTTSEIEDSVIGRNGWTPSNEYKIDTIVTGDIKSYLKKGNNRIVVQSSLPIPDYNNGSTEEQIALALQTGMMSAVLEVYGFSKPVAESEG